MCKCARHVVFKALWIVTVQHSCQHLELALSRMAATELSQIPSHTTDTH